MTKKFLIPVVDVKYTDENGKKIMTTKRAIETDNDGKKFIRVDGEIIYLKDE